MTAGGRTTFGRTKAGVQIESDSDSILQRPSLGGPIHFSTMQVVTVQAHTPSARSSCVWREWHMLRGSAAELSSKKARTVQQMGLRMDIISLR